MDVMTASPKLLVFEAGDYLIREEEASRTMYLLQSGRVKVIKSEGGHSIPMGEMNAGDVVGEVSFVDGEARSASVIALERVEALEMTPEEFDRFTEKVPIWLAAMVRSLAYRLRTVISKVERNPQEYLKASVCYLLVYFHNAEGSPAAHDRAALVRNLHQILRVPPAMVETALQWLVEVGRIELKEKTIRIPDAEALEKQGADLRRKLEEVMDY